MSEATVVSGEKAVIQPISPPPTDPKDVLFSAECLEGDAVIVRYAKPMILDGEQIIKLWHRLSQFHVLFASPRETSFKNFVNIIQDEYSVLLAFDDVGMALVSDLVPGVEVKVQFSFWDAKLKGREQLIRELVKWVIDVFGVRRVSMPVRADARAMRAFVERVGFYVEGILKNWVKKDLKLYDLYLYGVTESEVDELWLRGRSWAKPRVRPLKVYETN